jgi:hypothetical protein
MPGYRLPSLAAATILDFTAGSIQPLMSQNPTAYIAYLGSNSQLLISFHPEMTLFPMSGVLRGFTSSTYDQYASS